MFYATRTTHHAGRTETHALSFYSRRDRDQYCATQGAEPITAAERRKLALVGPGFTLVSAAKFVFFAQQTLPAEAAA